MTLPSDNQSRIVDSLKSLGLTKYEALVYIALLKVVSATATEIHEISGVPRASVYPVLDLLLDKNLVSVSQSSPKRFAALPPQDGIKNLVTRIEHDANYAREALLAIFHERIKAEHGGEELIWNIYGFENIQKRLADLLSGARQEIRIIAHPQLFSDEIRQVLNERADQVKIEIITPHWVGEHPKKVKMYVKKHPEMPMDLDKVKDIMAGGVCIVDNRRVMVILGSGEEEAVALISESAGFVRFFVRYYNLIINWAKNPN